MTKKLTPWLVIQLCWLETRYFIGDLARGTSPMDAWLAGVFFGACAALMLHRLF
jgi:hypothetical protein